MRGFPNRKLLACIILTFAANGIARSQGQTPQRAAAPATAPATRPVGFARWERDIAAFEAADKANPPPKDGVLFVGSSTIVRWTTLKQDFPGQPIINRGFGGNEIADSTHFADRMIIPYQPRMIFLRAGGNDIHNGKSAERVFADFKDFVSTVHSRLPNTEILFISLSPSIARWDERDANKALNKLVEDYARGTPRVKYIEVYDISLDASGQARPELFVADKLHFNAEGYKLLVERVRPFIPK